MHLDDDLAQFLQEVRAAVSVAYHDDELSELEQLVHDWRATANYVEASSYVEASRPAPRS